MIGPKRIIHWFILIGLFLFLFIYFLFNFNKSEWFINVNKSHLLTKSYQTSLIQVINAYSENLEPHTQAKICSCGQVEDISFDNDQWQKIEYKNIYLFSAFYDKRYLFQSNRFHFVRIISVIRDFLQIKLYCYLWSNSTSNIAHVVPAQTLELWMDIWGKGSSVTLYKSYLISCLVPKHLEYQIDGVSVSSHKCEKPETYLPVESKIQNLEAKDNFTVCVKALDFEKNISNRLIEWIELQFILGSSFINFYLFQVHPNTLKVLKYYQSIGKIKILPLTLPGQLPKVPLERSQFLKDNIWQKRRLELIPYNDCLYRNLYTHKFVVPLDIDEALIPVKDDNWNQLVKRIMINNSKAMKEYASFSAQNTFFFDLKENEGSSHDNLYMLYHFQRMINFSQPGFSVKSLISVDSSLAIFNHYTLFPLYSNMKRNALMSQKLAQLNHYRKNCPHGTDVCKKVTLNFKVDKILKKYKDLLTANVQKVQRKLNIIEELTDRV